ncbi:MAG: metalloregulator ArsR/SmtB family transcription factor [Propionibacteriaceae bacterium]|nr:metalloregulator ArsR/SmtB family transcription factor [Propionibacteriaceae bacterium]
MDDDLVFKALADSTRRLLLDALFERDGRSLGELDAVVAAHGIDMTRFAVAKHLRVLEAAGLVSSRKQGREKLHYLNPVPIQAIHERWIGRFLSDDQQPRRITEREVIAASLLDLKSRLEGDLPQHTRTPEQSQTPQNQPTQEGHGHEQ